MTKEKIHSVPAESKRAEIEAYTNVFLDKVSDLAVSTIYFFDEASVTKNTITDITVHFITGDLRREP